MNKQTLRTASVLAFAGAVAGIAFLVVRHSLLATHPMGIAVQVLAVGLMIWARVTFGRRSFHAAADPTAGGLVTLGLVARMLFEEKLVAAEYPKYAAYARRTQRVIPFVV